MQNVETIYQQTIRPLPLKDQLRLAELIRERAGSEAGTSPKRRAIEILHDMTPRKSVRTSAQIDGDLRAERDSWDD